MLDSAVSTPIKLLLIRSLRSTFDLLDSDKRILIIGQGIAGSLAAWYAQLYNIPFKIYDKGALESATAVSSGIINPVTGHRFVKSWMFNELLIEATAAYEGIARQLNRQIIRRLPIWRHLPDIQAENIWASRSIDERYEGLLSTPENSKWPKKYYTEAHAWGIVNQGYVLDTVSLLIGLREAWEKAGHLKGDEVELRNLVVDGPKFIYESETYTDVVIATGWKGMSNQFFDSDVYRPAKGEALICRISEFYEDRLIKYKKFIVPQGEGLYWVGSNYQHEFDNDLPDRVGRRQLEDWLRDEVGVKYEVKDHLSGIRAATKYRRPLVGKHPRYDGLYLLNGLGTKGISLAPYFARKIIESIFSDIAIEETSAFKKAFHI